VIFREQEGAYAPDRAAAIAGVGSFVVAALPLFSSIGPIDTWDTGCTVGVWISLGTIALLPG